MVLVYRQHIVQRVLAAKNIKEARTGTIFAGYLKILPVFIFVLPGIVALALFPEIRNNPDSAYPTLVTRLLPDGIKGLVLAGMLAALMSSLASAFNACSPADVGRLSQNAPHLERAAARASGPHFRRGHGVPGPAVDSVHEVRLIPDLHLSAERPGLHRAADRGLLPAWLVLPPAQRAPARLHR